MRQALFGNQQLRRVLPPKHKKIPVVALLILPEDPRRRARQAGGGVPSSDERLLSEPNPVGEQERAQQEGPHQLPIQLRRDSNSLITQTFNTIHSILQVLQKHRPLGTEEIFYDLGSGSGKVLFAASLCHSFRKCVGIEYL